MRIRSLLAILVVGFGLGLAACRQANGSVATVVPTSTATFTPAPTETLTPSPSSIPGPLQPSGTPLPKFTASAPGVSIKSEPGGSKLFIDGLGQYQLLVPPDWSIMNLSSDDTDRLFSAAVTRYPEQASQYKWAKGFTTKGARLLLIDTNVQHVTQGTAPFVTAAFVESTQKVDLNFLITTTVQELTQMYPGAQVLSSGVSTSPKGQDFGLAELLLPMKDRSGSDILVYEKLLLLQTVSYTVSVRMVVNENIRSAVVPAFDKMVDSLDWQIP